MDAPPQCSSRLAIGAVGCLRSQAWHKSHRTVPRWHHPRSAPCQCCAHACLCVCVCMRAHVQQPAAAHKARRQAYTACNHATMHATCALPIHADHGGRFSCGLRRGLGRHGWAPMGAHRGRAWSCRCRLGKVQGGGQQSVRVPSVEPRLAKRSRPPKDTLQLQVLCSEPLAGAHAPADCPAAPPPARSPAPPLPPASWPSSGALIARLGALTAQGLLPPTLSAVISTAPA